MSAQLTHFLILRLALKIRPGAEKVPVNSGWQAEVLESPALQVSKRKCSEKSQPFLEPPLSCKGFLFWWDWSNLTNQKAVVYAFFFMSTFTWLIPSPPVWKPRSYKNRDIPDPEPKWTPAHSRTHTSHLRLHHQENLWIRICWKGAHRSLDTMEWVIALTTSALSLLLSSMRGEWHLKAKIPSSKSF